MRNRTLCLSLALFLLSSAACAPATATLPMTRPAANPAAQVSDLQLPQDTDIVVQLLGGQTRGRLRSIARDRLWLRSTDATGTTSDRGVPHDEIALVARVVKTTSRARGCLGAAIGAAASLPFAISQFGDMVVPGAIVGALIGRRTGHTRGEVVFERQASPADRSGDRVASRVE